MKIYAKVEGCHYEFERPEQDSRGFIIDSCAKYCPMCLAGWSHITCVLNEGTANVRMKGYHRVAGQLCPCCGRTVDWKPQAVPGSLLEEPWSNCQTVDWDLLNYLPLELLRREFELHYEFLVSKESQQNGNTAMARRGTENTSNERTE